MTEEWFLTRSEISPTGCWIWKGSLNPDGYPFFSQKSVHRLSYQILVGPIPDGMEIDHLCRQRACVNPHHLEAVTHKVNVLRGNGPTAKNAQKTHCPRGHPYDIRLKSGGRWCSICAKTGYAKYDKHKHPNARNKDKTHCPQGHEYTPDNTYRWKPNSRQCKTCKRDRSRKRPKCDNTDE
jgi:hypothetical protein